MTSGWRKNKPVGLAVGPVLHADDAVANKVCALFGRAEVRDYVDVDVDAIVASGRYTEDELLGLAPITILASTAHGSRRLSVPSNSARGYLGRRSEDPGLPASMSFANLWMARSGR